jgi:hypothetical protein
LNPRAREEDGVRNASEYFRALGDYHRGRCYESLRALAVGVLQLHRSDGGHQKPLYRCEATKQIDLR